MHRPRPYALAVALVLASCERPTPARARGSAAPPVPAAARDRTATDHTATDRPPADPTPAAPATPGELTEGATASFELAKPVPPSEAPLLAAWYATVGRRRPGEDYGALVARTALAQLGRPYRDPPAPAGPERLEVRLEDFDCLTLVESSLAVARCVDAGVPDAACFARELEATRYRGGVMGDFASRLHYFTEWVSDNASRGRLTDLTAELGGTTARATFDFMTHHRLRYAPLADPRILAELRAVEAALRRRPVLAVDRRHARDAAGRLSTGDIVGFVGSRPGLVVSHTAFVVRGQDGVARVLHASSYQGRVVLTEGDLGDYVLRRPERTGFVAARPLAPATPPAATARRGS